MTDWVPDPPSARRLDGAGGHLPPGGEDVGRCCTEGGLRRRVDTVRWWLTSALPEGELSSASETEGAPQTRFVPSIHRTICDTPNVEDIHTSLDDLSPCHTTSFPVKAN